MKVNPMKKKFLFILGLIFFIVSISSVSASADVNQTIINENDDTIGVSYDDRSVLSDSYDFGFGNMAEALNPYGGVINCTHRLHITCMCKML